MIRQSQAPTILLTRPLVQSQRFSAELTAALGPLRVVISPLMAVEFLRPRLTHRPYSAVIFTSETAVQAAADLPDAAMLPRRAYCVGPRTARAARENGFDAIAAEGDSTGLIAVIERNRPAPPLLFLRGQESTGSVAEVLSSAGIETDSAIVYRQNPQDLTAEARHLLLQRHPVILPLFSPRSARLLVQAVQTQATQLHIAAISAAVAAEAAALHPARILTAARPDGAAMVTAVGELLAALRGP